MYARFFTKALADLGQLDVQEPFANLFAQGMITRDGAKMSKSKGNTVSPGEYVERYGADTARTYVCFMGPPERGGDWTDEGVEGVNRFLSRLWRLCEEVESRTEPGEPDAAAAGEARELLAKAHWAIDKATRDFQRGFQFNTAISAVMELVNDAYRLKDGLYGTPEGGAAVRFATATAASLIFPFAPHLGAEVYERLTGSAGLGAALAARPTRSCWSATRSPWSSRSTASCATGSRPPAEAPEGGAAARWPGRARRSPRTSTARKSSRRSSFRASWSTWWSGSGPSVRARPVLVESAPMLVRRLEEAAVEEWHRLRAHVLMDAGELGLAQSLGHLADGAGRRRADAALLTRRPSRSTSSSAAAARCRSPATRRRSARGT